MQRASLIAELVRNLPAMQETQVLSLGLEDPVEKEMATHSSILAWRISRTETETLSFLTYEKDGWVNRAWLFPARTTWI